MAATDHRADAGGPGGDIAEEVSVHQMSVNEIGFLVSQQGAQLPQQGEVVISADAEARDRDSAIACFGQHVIHGFVALDQDDQAGVEAALQQARQKQEQMPLRAADACDFDNMDDAHSPSVEGVLYDLRQTCRPGARTTSHAQA